MAIKQVPVMVKTYYKTMIESTRKKHSEVSDKYEKLLVEVRALHEDVKSKMDIYESKYNIPFYKYKEYIENKYIDGQFYTDAKSKFISKKTSDEHKHIVYKFYKLARVQKDVHELKAQIDLYDKMLDLSIADYQRIMRIFYNEVHKQMIINGYGYMFENPMGWICINRCKIVPRGRGLIDFQATKKNKERLLSEGKRLWNKKEAEYARSLGLEYNGVDYRVFKNDEYTYEIPLIGCRVKNDGNNKFKTTEERNYLKTHTEQDLLEACNNDPVKVCEFNIDIREKLKLCLKLNDILYLNFIRNEAQQSAHTAKINRKSR